MLPKESHIVSSICDYLAARRYFFWRQNTYGIFDTTTQRHRALPKHSMRGVPDIILIREGAFIGLECKRPGGRLSPDQLLFRHRCQEAGAQYHTVTSIDDVQALGL